MGGGGRERERERGKEREGERERKRERKNLLIPIILAPLFPSQFHESHFTLRTRETHAYHCSSLGGPLHDHSTTAYGITCDSILSSSRFFHA